jgi:hypothetical protein
MNKNPKHRVATYKQTLPFTTRGTTATSHTNSFTFRHLTANTTAKHAQMTDGKAPSISPTVDAAVCAALNCWSRFGMKVEPVELCEEDARDCFELQGHIQRSECLIDILETGDPARPFNVMAVKLKFPSFVAHFWGTMRDTSSFFISEVAILKRGQLKTVLRYNRTPNPVGTMPLAPVQDLSSESKPAEKDL